MAANRIVNSPSIRAQPSRLYPSLPSPTSSSVVLSSDEEEIIVDDEQEEREVRPAVVSPRVSSPPGITPRAFCHSTVSLNDFEDSYMRQKQQNLNRKPSYNTNSTSNNNTNKFSTSVLTLVLWVWSFGRNYYKPFIAILFGLFVVLLLGDNYGPDNLLLCKSKSVEPCLNKTELKIILPLAKELRQLLHETAGQSECGVDISRNKTVKESKLLLSSRHHNAQISRQDMQTISFLFIHNPQWKINVLKSDGVMITDPNLDLTDTDIFGSARPHKGVVCRIRNTAQVIWNRLKLLGIIFFFVFLLVIIVRWYYKKQKDEQRAVYLLVEDIIDVLKGHYRKSVRGDKILPYVAIIHVRDMLIPPSERQRKQVIWDKAVEWLATNESRVRVETRIIAGQQHTVWNWIQAEPPPTEELDGPSIPLAVPIPVGDSSAWPGRAFEDYPPDLENKFAPPVGSPSPCIRLKNMFEHIKHMPEHDIVELENAVLERCGYSGSVVHIYVDKRSVHGCIYFKMDSISSASTAYKVFHGVWFKGRLVTAKFIPEPKYYKWFPRAQKAHKPLTKS